MSRKVLPLLAAIAALGQGTASHCTRWEPITQTLCERQCTSGGVYYWR